MEKFYCPNCMLLLDSLIPCQYCQNTELKQINIQVQSQHLKKVEGNDS
ncbi:hypothetical protein [Metabacillus arenae]|uniref:Uncharacterized protein n=1 Tax=Metabacillus arenae TaxID=2771434 RepID=A0A926NEG2_9BACI|nr:hypothetical protein [Metabacillus arenae]MBD1379335.1 hypothetical protein [Metabacillus arenae]